MSRYDDDDDDAPRGRSTSRRRYEDDDEDDKPARRSTRRDDDEEEKPSRRSSSRYEDDDEDDKPASRRSRRDDDDDDADARPTRRRSRDDDDDEDDKSAPKRVTPKTLKRGWGAADKVKAAASTYADRLVVTTDEQLIKFLEDDPYVSFNVHWLRRNGQKTWNCIASEDPKGCPLCNAGDVPQARVCFNVALMDTEDGGEPIVKSLEASSATAEQIKNHHKDAKNGPITKHYWSIKKASSQKTAGTILNPVRARDLGEDWNVEPLSDAQFKALEKNLYDPSIVTLPTRNQMKELAAEELGAD